MDVRGLTSRPGGFNP